MKAKYYEALAEAIKQNTTFPPHRKLSWVIYGGTFLDALCDILKAESPRFDESKFRELVK